MIVLALATGAVLSLSVEGRAFAQEAAGRKASPPRDCSLARDIALLNGKIMTMAEPAQVSAVVIRDGRIVHLGRGGEKEYTACTQVFDLQGRTAVPGLIDAHIHFVTWGYRPGHDVRLDLANSMDALLRSLHARAVALAAGEWVTAVGGWARTQLIENRLPTLAELDQAAPANPVFLWEREGLTAVTNTSGRAFFDSKGIAVNPDGTISADKTTDVAYYELAQRTTNPKRGFADAMAHIAKLGLTTVADGAVNASPGGRSPERSWHSGHVDLYSAYDPLLKLEREGKLTVRVRVNFSDNRNEPSNRPHILNYQFPLFGSDTFKTLCMGEFIAPVRTEYEAAAFEVAKRGWCHEQHTEGLADIRNFLDTWEKVNATYPIQDLHWRLAHVATMDGAALDRIKKLGAGVNVSATGWSRDVDVPYRTIVRSGVPVAGISDGPN